MYRVDIILEHMAQSPWYPLDDSPWWFPLWPENPSPVPESLLLTWNPSSACGATPVHSGPRLLVNWPPPSPFPPHSLFLPPTVPHFNYVPFQDDITTSTSYSLIQPECCYIKYLDKQYALSTFLSCHFFVGQQRLWLTFGTGAIHFF